MPLALYIGYSLIGLLSTAIKHYLPDRHSNARLSNHLKRYCDFRKSIVISERDTTGTLGPDCFPGEAYKEIEWLYLKNRILAHENFFAAFARI